MEACRILPAGRDESPRLPLMPALITAIDAQAVALIYVKKSQLRVEKYQ